jgi:hypothetical protein
MDIFYYWKDYDADLEAGRIGWLPAPRKRLAELRERHPDSIWAFRQPKHRKGQLQLLARLRWTDAPTVKLALEKGAPVIYYDPAQSTCFADVDNDTRIAELTSLIRGRFPGAFAANFRGDAGLHPMEADFLHRFIPKLASYPSEPFPAYSLARLT